MSATKSQPLAVAVIPDRFATQQEARAQATQDTLGRTGIKRRLMDVRRPVRGIQLKDETFATLQIVRGNGERIPLVNAGATTPIMVNGKVSSDNYSNFLIQGVQEERAEKSQVVETFGEAFIFFFGERPRVLNVAGILVNTFDFNWEAEWWWNYENYLRGTRCVQNDARIYLVFDETLVSGYIMSASAQRSTENPNFVPFNFQLFVTDYTNLSRLGDNSANQHPDIQPVDDPIDYMYNYRAPIIPWFGDLSTPTTTLAQSLMEAAATVQATWAMARSITNNMLITAASFAGNPVRVPVGFAGAFSADDPIPIQMRTSAGDGLQDAHIDYGQIHYSTFNNNSDEYVGRSPHYVTTNDLAAQLFQFQPDSTTAAKAVADATLAWAKQGLVAPPEVVQKTVAIMARTEVGMKILGNAQAGIEVAKKGATAGFNAAEPKVMEVTGTTFAGASLADSLGRASGNTSFLPYF